MSALVLAIDGPSGSGKSSTSKAIAIRANWSYLDTDEWVKTTKAGKKFSVTFYPFWETNPVFACAISEDGEPYKGQNGSFKVKVTPTGKT